MQCQKTFFLFLVYIYTFTIASFHFCLWIKWFRFKTRLAKGPILELAAWTAKSAKSKSLIYAPCPAEQSEAGLGAFYFCHIQIFSRLLEESCSRLLCILHISSNGSNFLTAWVLAYWIYKVSIFGYGWKKLIVTMYTKYTAHITSNGSYFLAACSLVYWTY